MKGCLPLIVLCCTQLLTAQNLPNEYYRSADQKILYCGGKPTTGLYDQSTIKNLYLNFTQSNYWTLLTNNYTTKKDLLASMTYDGVTYDSIGVRFKGQTSFGGGPGGGGTSTKKSFNISMDAFGKSDKLLGYKTLNLNNAFQDPSFMREVFYYNTIRTYSPAAKANWVRLFLNGQDWGLYPNVQQLNGDFLQEWYPSNNGSNWRADAAAVPGGGGGGWGNGTTAFNYLGDDTLQYKKYYTLNSAHKPQPWADLAKVCKVLNQTPIAGLDTAIAPYLNIDKTLWHLAAENAFSDDDSYIYKGRMDYYLYQDAETGRFQTYDYDGNSVMTANLATWSPFYNAEKVNYPLLNRLLQVPSIRQRYIAHLKTIVTEGLDTAKTNKILAQFAAQIDTSILADPKKATTYAQFTTSLATLRKFINDRRNTILNNAEFKQPQPTIATVDYFTNDVANSNPNENQDVVVKSKVEFVSGLQKVWLYYGLSYSGLFDKTEMFDDGQHNDGAASDGLFGGVIPRQPSGSLVRFYIEAVANNPARTVSYSPVGAEHDVYVYQVKYAYLAESSVVINEVVSSNDADATDEADEREDWIELYNKSDKDLDLGGYSISDNDDLRKWVIPAGTFIPARGYRIIWADEDGSQGPMHANFKLSSSGERLVLVNAQNRIADTLSFGKITKNKSYSRIPNGTGSYIEKKTTFGYNNEWLSSTEADLEAGSVSLKIVPNPASEAVYIFVEGASKATFFVTNNVGHVFYRSAAQLQNEIDVSNWPAGTYFVKCGTVVEKMLIIK